MKPLIDADVLRYEVGAVGQDEDGPRSFDYVAEVLDGKIRDICAAVGATVPPTLYLTGSGNFREKVAKTKPYKGNRKQEKPYHFKHLTDYMLNTYDTVIIDGMEADDIMSVTQVQNDKDLSDPDDGTYGPRTVICTRDKDLRMVPGWHYGWECGAQREFGPLEVHENGYLTMDIKTNPKGVKTYKVRGAGKIFFWAQMLIGDTTDNIPGCKGVGDKTAYEMLTSIDPKYHEDAVRDMYLYKNMTEEQFIEQGQLLWMVRELTEDGNPVMWKPSED